MKVSYFIIWIQKVKSKTQNNYKDGILGNRSYFQPIDKIDGMIADNKNIIVP